MCESWVSNTNLQTKAAKLTLNLTTKKLSYNGKEIDAFTQEYAESNGGVLYPLPFGIWKIEIPDAPHELGIGYEEFSLYSTTWFPIDTPKTLNRYVHLGSLSHGCATIGINRIRAKDRNPKEEVLEWIRRLHKVKFTIWTDLCEYLMKSRLDNKYVGEIEVIIW